MDGRSDGVKAQRGRKLTEPDRLLCAHLARVRYLTKEQAWRLVYPGRWESKVSERISALESLGLLRRSRSNGSRLEVRAVDGRPMDVIALTPAGYRLALGSLGELPKVPTLDVGAQYLRHATGVVELYLAMVGAGPERLGPRNRRGVKRSSPKLKAAPAPLPIDWTWTPGESVSIPISPKERQQRRPKISPSPVAEDAGSTVLCPDAVIEFKQTRLRVFVEWETGTNPLNSGKRAALMTKFDRYEELFRGISGLLESKTWYASAYPDGYAARVVFALHSQQRKTNVATAFEEWVKRFAPRFEYAPKVFALYIFEEAGAMLARMAGSASPQAQNSTTPPTSAEAERLRPGRVSVRGEQLVTFARVLGSALRTMDEAHRAGAPPPAPKPEELRAYQTLTVYAERGRKALAEHGLTESV
jgi:Replication-relaxation